MGHSFDDGHVIRGQGQSENGLSELEPLAGALRRALIVDLDEQTVGHHLVAMRSARAEVRPTKARPIHSGHRRARIRVVWAAGVAGLGLAFSGMAAAGALPSAAQHRVARAVAAVGIHIPDPAAHRNPGNRDTNPGHGGSIPGNGGTNPGHGGSIPGNGGTNPGHGGTIPGNGGTNPSGTNPGTGTRSPGTGGTNTGAGGSKPTSTIPKPTAPPTSAGRDAEALGAEDRTGPAMSDETSVRTQGAP
jgi:hypothetical protein